MILVFFSQEEVEFLEREKKKFKEFNESEIIQNVICARGGEPNITLSCSPSSSVGRQGKIISIELHDKAYTILKYISDRTGLTDDLAIRAILKEYMGNRKKQDLMQPPTKQATWNDEEDERVEEEKSQKPKSFYSNEL